MRKPKIIIGAGVKKHSTKHGRLYPWQELKRGESFWTSRKSLTMAPQASKKGDWLNRKFSCVKENGGCRITRTK